MELVATDRVRLERIVADRNSMAKHVYRARMVLLAGEGLGTTRIAHAVGKSEPTVWTACCAMRPARRAGRRCPRPWSSRWCT